MTESDTHGAVSNSDVGTPYQQRLASAAVTIQSLLDKPFPKTSLPIDDSINWENFAALLSGNKSWLVELIGIDYTDTDVDPEEATVPNGLKDSYIEDFEKVVHIVETALAKPAKRLKKPDYRQMAQEWGQGRKLGSVAGTEHRFFPDMFFDFDDVRIAYWELDERYAVVHFASTNGDGDFQVSLCLGVLKPEAA